MYSARITRLNPTAFIFLIDQSGSMEERVLFNTEKETKAESVALVTNRLIGELAHRSCREDGIRDYFDIAVIGYSDDQAYSLLSSRNGFMRPTELLQMECPQRTILRERRLPNGQTITTTHEQKYWVMPKSKGNTPMYAALLSAYELAERWCNRAANRNSYPITIFNITDGEASDGNEDRLLEIANRIKCLHTDNGNALLINIHISSRDHETQVVFPASERELPNDKYARLLYDMSSQMPDNYNETILSVRNTSGCPPFRGMSYNTSIVNLITMMNIGSISVNMIV